MADKIRRTNSEYDKLPSCHSLNVTAETLYEAVARALAAMHGHEWAGDIGRGLTTVTLKVRNPEVIHIVKVQDFENWLNSRPRPPVCARFLLGGACYEMLTVFVSHPRIL